MFTRINELLMKDLWPRTLRRQSRPKVIVRRHGITIAIPSRLADGSALAACRGVLGMVAGSSLFVVFALLLVVLPSVQWLLVVLVVFLVSAGLYGGLTVCVKRQIVFSQDDMSFRQLVLRISVERSPQYPLRHIHNIRVDTGVSLTNGHLMFDYKGTPITCQDTLSRHLASHTAAIMSEMLRFSCSTIERIIFGTPRVAIHDPSRTLLNPDVSDLSLPFARLRHLIIYGDTYSIRQVEQFLTYVLNTYKAAYFRKYVTVDVYGEQQEVHPNIWNNLTHLCKSVSLHHSTLPPWQDVSCEEAKG